jgi:ABC-2 type transport system ATP-binding protein
VYDAQPAQIGDAAGSEGLWLHELTLVQSSLEEAFMRLTAGSVEYHAGQSGDAEGERVPDGTAMPGWGTPVPQEIQDSQPSQFKERIQ